jgi:hypothetical protein|tara:strand:- start:50 stop:268 length:219 start_codon:yes stop_codon:yes gene_type:complete
MAHFIKLTNIDGSKTLYNLDVVVSMDPLENDATVIQTRWGSSKVKEDVDTILKLASQDNGTATGHQLLNEGD